MLHRILLLVTLLQSAPVLAEDCVILLHGLARVSNAMNELERKLQASGFAVANINYPSRKYPISELSSMAIGEGLASCEEQATDKVHFVVHSLGGILLRYYMQNNELPQHGRSVMLGTPNQGAELADHLRRWPGYGLLGPSAQALGTDAEGIAASLEAVDFELGVIAGNININPLAGIYLSEDNDSVVSVESTRVAGMKEHLVLPVIHTTMMRDNELIDHTIHFLKTGNFIPK